MHSLNESGSYVDTLLQRFAPEGIPDSFHANHTPAEVDLRERVEDAISAARQGSGSADASLIASSVMGPPCDTHSSV